jgi:outer membrane protein assembly factor BamD (BamD/ComL family)
LAVTLLAVSGQNSGGIKMKNQIYSKVIYLKVLLCLICYTLSAPKPINANPLPAGFYQTNNSINGFIFGEGRMPLADVQVELLDEYNRLVVRVRTDGGGRYRFDRLTTGRFYIRVLPMATNYEEQTQEVEIVSNRALGGRGGADTIQQNFTLRMRRTMREPLAINAVIFAQEIPKEAQKLYEKAVSDLKESKIDEGIRELKDALDIFPQYYLALERLGQEYINRQHYEAARDVFTKAVEINPRGAESQYGLGYSLYQLKSHAEAIEAIKKSIELNPTSVNGLFLLGVNLRLAGKYAEAVESLKKAEKLTTVPLPEVHWQLSLLYTNNLKKYSAAADELELFLKAKPDFDEIEKVKDLIKKLRAKAKAS